MQQPIRVLVLGTGQMGSGIARLLLQKQGIELVGACARRVERAGMDLGRAIGLDHDLGIPVRSELETLVSQSRPQIAIQATCSRVADARHEIETLVRHGVHVISIAEEMVYPAASDPEFAGEMHRLAVAHGVSILGTGINPGFVLDLLVITLTGVCADIQSITATRVNDLSPYGASVLRSQGVGLDREAFYSGLADGTIVGHFGFAESIHMIASAIGWDIERIDHKLEPIISSVRREAPCVIVEPGQVAGCHHSAVAYHDGNPVISFNHPQQVCPRFEGVATGDSIEIRGTPAIHLSGSPEIPGGQSTCALAVNMIPRVLNAPPGLHTMADLPVPSAILADMRHFVDSFGPENAHG